MHRLPVFATSLLGAGFLGWAIFRNLYPKKKYLVPVNEWDEAIGESKNLRLIMPPSYMIIPASAAYKMPLEWQDKFANVLQQYFTRITSIENDDAVFNLSMRLPNGRIAKLENRQYILKPPTDVDIYD